MEFEMKGECFFVGISMSGYTWSIPYNGDSKNIPKTGFIKGQLIIKSNEKLNKIKYDLINDLTKLSKDAKISAPEGLISIMTSKLQDTKDVIENAQDEIETYKQELIENYTLIKNEDFTNLKDSISSLPEETQKNILSYAKNKYPTIQEIKTRVNLNASILTSPSVDTGDFKIVKDMVEKDVLRRYKQAVFDGLDPIYRMLCQIYIRLDNGLDIHLKTKNAMDTLIAECKNANVIRKDGFTDNVLDYIQSYKNDLYDSLDISYNAIVNIYNEASSLGVQDSLANIKILEHSIENQMKRLKNIKTNYTPSLSYEKFDIDKDAIPKLKDLI